MGETMSFNRRALLFFSLLSVCSGLVFGANASQPGPIFFRDFSQESAPIGPPSPSDPAAAPLRDDAVWPQGYYTGDPVPLHTIYLTFDDGPSDFTAQILDILKEEKVRATFFLNSYDKDNPFHADTGQNYMFRYADVLRRMVDEGHAIGNHTYSHRDLARLTLPQIDFQLDTLQRQLGEALGDGAPRLHLIRPPFGSPWLGDWNSELQRMKVCSALEDRGIVMLWTTGWDSSDSADWVAGEWFEASAKRYHPGSAPYERKMEREANRILRRANGVEGGIVLMHDTHPTSRDILKSLIEELKYRGYGFGTLEDYCRWRWGPGVFDRFAPMPSPTPEAAVPLRAGQFPSRPSS